MSEQNPDPGGIPPVERMRHEIDRWFETLRTTGERALESLGLAGTQSQTSPCVDVIELPEEIVVLIDLPGVPTEKVELSLVGSMLTVSAIRARPEFPNTVRTHLRERTVDRFQRSIPLPAVVDCDAIRPETRDGQLTVMLRKATANAGRTIPVSRSGGS